jgi:hypothetical protein
LGQLELENSSDYQSIIPASWDALETIYPEIFIYRALAVFCKRNVENIEVGEKKIKF